MPTLSPNQTKALGHAAIPRVLAAMRDTSYLSKLDAWAMAWFGLPYAEVRLKRMDELEPRLSEWMETLRRPDAVLHGDRVEVVSMD